jgi:hypothetical protein
MRLNQEQVERLRQHLQQRLRGGCNACGNPNWQFDDVIFELRQFVGGGISADSLIKPLIAITCTNCGNVMLMNAIAAGVLRVEQQAGSQPNQQSFSETPVESVAVEEASEEA